MSTRAFIVKKVSDNEYISVYHHSDSYLEYLGAILYYHYNNEKRVNGILALGDLSILAKYLRPDYGIEHSFNNPAKDVTVAYCRDREMDAEQTNAQVSETLPDLESSMVDYIYIWDTDRWYVTSRDYEYLPLEKLILALTSDHLQQANNIKYS